MPARNRETRPYTAPQARTVGLRFPNWTRFRIPVQVKTGRDFMAKGKTAQVRRAAACQKLITRARAIIQANGTGESALDPIRKLLVTLADKGEALFPKADFPMPGAQARNHVLALEDGDGIGLYLTISLPGKEAAPHDHGIWCVNAALSEREAHRFYRRTDDRSRDGYATVEQIGEVVVAPGHGMMMTDHAIHATEVLGEEPAFGLALYGYALTRFPAVTWFHPEFNSVRVGASRRMAPFSVTIGNTGQTIRCAGDKPILVAAIEAGIDYPYTCATGNCASCISELRTGEVTLLPY